MKVLLKKLNDDAKIPVKKHGEDFCYDVFAVSDAEPAYDDNGEVIPNVLSYKTGLAYEIVRDGVFLNDEINISIDGRPRSSIYKTGLSLCNCEATLDEPYRGEIKVNFYDIIPSLPKYKKGDKICQIKLGFTIPMEFEWTNEISETERGEGGFGSTGK